MNAVQIETWRHRHANRLEQAKSAISARIPWSPFDDQMPAGILQLTAGTLGRLEQLIGTSLALDPGHETDLSLPEHGGECSPYGPMLNIRYSVETFASQADKALSAMRVWASLPHTVRSSVLLECVSRLHAQTELFTQVGMHISGHSLLMAYHANAIHAQARAIESIAHLDKLQSESRLNVEAPLQDTHNRRKLRRQFSTHPVGLSLIYTERTLPTWNGYASIFASLAAGCPVIVLPHPGAVLPLALTIQIIRDTLREAGLPPDILQMNASPDSQERRAAAQHPAVRLIDYSGRRDFANWLHTNAGQARVLAQTGGSSPVILHSTDDYHGLIRNLAFGLCSYSGQLCTSPRRLHLSTLGIDTPLGTIAPEQFGQDLTSAIDQLLDEQPAPSQLLGAIVNVQHYEHALHIPQERASQILRLGGPVEWPQESAARALSPTLLLIPPSSSDAAQDELPPPITPIYVHSNWQMLLDATKEQIVREHALGIALYAMDTHVVEEVERLAFEHDSLLSVNFCGSYYPSQCSIFADIHGGKDPYNSGFNTPQFYSGRLKWREKREETEVSV
ncbi:aldehyde dehydrogenase family protein [Chromobacterium phragmitis]|uniref:Aldehyde dehydrogenase domain-containing protein n=1 Tax=Chromobacterium phragmitis TaxID=2202141 RepID=A0A344UDE8_9NEIS|nr:aldehyde dehydrogenase family protein [Chromobacterium phragmitis]AXE33296.1 hypothetical protein DK843_02580 [Chromobacterium phragmitis]